MPIEITSSPSPRRMPRTPVELRPAKTRTSGTAKRIHWPSAVVSRISSFSEQIFTDTMPSSSSSFIAILPLRFTRVKSDNLLRRTVPVFVANMTSSSLRDSSSSGSGMTLSIRSSAASGKILTSALPREFGPPIGKRQTFSL